MTEWASNVDWIQTAGFMVTFAIFVGLTFGGWAYYNSERAKVHTKEADLLVRTRGAKIDDLQEELEEVKRKNAEEIASLHELIANQQGQIDMLRKLKTAEIIEGVREGLVEEIVIELKKNPA